MSDHPSVEQLEMMREEAAAGDRQTGFKVEEIDQEIAYMGEEPPAVQLADALVWKLEHPQQHTTCIDQALDSFVQAVDRGELEAPPELVEQARERIA